MEAATRIGDAAVDGAGIGSTSLAFVPARAARRRLLVCDQQRHDAAKEARRYVNSGAAGAHLADQLLLPLAAGSGGSFTTTPLSSHATTNMDVIRRFVDTPMTVEQVSNGVARVRVG